MEKPMELNKETALRLWTQQFGKVAKATDFAGREIAKAGYNNRNSRFCWNVDHILPQSRGGKTADYNLICCHMETNDEKADSFPCFTANHKHFQIERRQNHYEIICISDSQDENADSDGVNFYDAAQGIKCWEDCHQKADEVCIGYVKVQLDYPKNGIDLSAFQIFLEELFESSSVFSEISEPIWNNCLNPHKLCTFTLLVDDLPTKDDTENLLNQCILLNTYREFFMKRYDCQIRIACGMNFYDSFYEKSANIQRDIIDKRISFHEELAIDELIRINTSAEKELTQQYGIEFYPYNMVFTKLQKDLKKHL